MACKLAQARRIYLIIKKTLNIIEAKQWKKLAKVYRRFGFFKKKSLNIKQTQPS